MKAAYYERQGGPEVLQVGQLGDPSPGPGEVRVRIAVSGLTPSDLLRRRGLAGPMAFPRIVPHSDGAGTIDEVGHGVPAERLGTRVWVYNAQWRRPFGTCAEWVVVPAALAVPLPEGVSFALGASLGIPATTAHYALFSDGDIRDKRVLIVGGAGSVGRFAIQLARWGGAEVFATVDTAEKAEVARRAGAHVVIGPGEFDTAETVLEATQRRGVDRIVEVAFGANLAANVKMLAERGVIATYSSATDVQDFPFRPLLQKHVTVRFVLVYLVGGAARERALNDLSTAIAERALTPNIASRFPLDAVASAHAALERGGLIGNVLIDVHADASH